MITLTPRRLFIALGVLATLAIIAFRGESLLIERAQLLRQRQVQAGTLAQFAATYSARLYDQSSAVAKAVAEHLRSEPLSNEALRDYLVSKAADTTADDYIVVLDAEGRVRATSEDLQTSTVRFGSKSFAAQWRESKQEVVPVLRSRLTGAVIYSLSQRLEDRNGSFIGVVGVNVRPEGIQPTAKRKPGDPLLSLWDHRGRFIAASFVDFDETGHAFAPAKPAQLGVSGSSRQGDPESLSASLPVQGWPLVAVASYRKQGVLAAWRRDAFEAGGIVLLTVLVIGTLVWLGVRTADRETATRSALETSNRVTEAALKDRDLLMKEVHHRVKNSLVMTSSLLYLQERRFEDPAVREAFASTRRRLSSIGLVHEALYSGSSLELVDLLQYLPRLLDELGEAYGAEARGVTISTEVEAIRLSAEQTTPVGLIVAEVVTNAFKHAFAGNGAGALFVRVHRCEPAEILVEVRDDGSGYPNPSASERSGLGTRLIAALTEQLRGTVSKSNDGGAVFRLSFPSKSA